MNFTSLVRTMLERGADPDVRDGMGNTVLRETISAKSFALLIAYGIDMNARNWEGTVLAATTPDYWAGASIETPRQRHVEKAVLASRRLCEDVARMLVEMTQ